MQDWLECKFNARGTWPSLEDKTTAKFEDAQDARDIFMEEAASSWRKGSSRRRVGDGPSSRQGLRKRGAGQKRGERSDKGKKRVKRAPYAWTLHLWFKIEP